MAKTDRRQLVTVARGAIERALRERFDVARDWPAPLAEGVEIEESQVVGLFVTLWSPGARLRGCIGRHVRLFPALHEEVADCAVRSALEDSRFQPLAEGELTDIKIEISLLSSPELVQDVRELDPGKWGVIVSAGRRRATLLPGIDGVETVEQQLAIVRDKAGIAQHESVILHRFSVEKVVDE